MAFAIFMLIMLAIIVFSVYMFKVTSKAQKQARQETEQSIKDYNAVSAASLPLTSGLPLAEGTVCHLFVTDSQLIIKAESQEFRVNNDQIIAAQPKTDVEIQQEVTSSAGKAIAGALLFGPVGAIIGARTRTKKKNVVNTYLIINYTSQTGDVAVLAFETCPTNLYKALNERIKQPQIGTVTNL